MNCFHLTRRLEPIPDPRPSAESCRPAENRLRPIGGSSPQAIAPSTEHRRASLGARELTQATSTRCEFDHRSLGNRSGVVLSDSAWVCESRAEHEGGAETNRADGRGAHRGDAEDGGRGVATSIRGSEHGWCRGRSPGRRELVRPSTDEAGRDGVSAGQAVTAAPSRRRARKRHEGFHAGSVAAPGIVSTGTGESRISRSATLPRSA
jgi:hypothetical protein